MPKALLFSDLHIHSKNSSNRLQDCLAVLEWVFQQAQYHACSHILFLGDLFHERAKIDVLNYLRTFEVFMKYMLGNRPNYDVHLLIGNHDMYHKEKWDVNSVKPLSAIPGVNIIAEPCTLEIGGRLLDFCPHIDNPFKALEQLKARSVETERILMGHLAVHGATLNTMYGTKADVIVEYDNDLTPVKPEVFAAWDQVYLGHYHGEQQLGSGVEYLGSPLQLSFGEAFQQKHLLILDLETLEKRYVVNDFSPKHYIITPDELDVYDLNGQFVRFIISDMSNKDLIDFKRQVLQKYQVASLDFKERPKRDEDEQLLVQDAKAILLDEVEMLKNYIQRAGVDGLKEVDLFELGNVACQSIAEYQSQAAKQDLRWLAEIWEKKYK